MKQQRTKLMSIINMCNAIKSSDKKEDVDFWLLRIKDICEEDLKCKN